MVEAADPALTASRRSERTGELREDRTLIKRWLEYYAEGSESWGDFFNGTTVGENRSEEAVAKDRATAVVRHTKYLEQAAAARERKARKEQAAL